MRGRCTKNSLAKDLETTVAHGVVTPGGAGAKSERMHAATHVEHDKAWGRIFAEQMQHRCEALGAGEASAVAEFMVSEPQRKLQDVLALHV